MQPIDSLLSSSLDTLARSGNLRSIPAAQPAGCVDLSSNDYLGLTSRTDLQQRFLAEAAQEGSMLLTSSASRLLAACQSEYSSLESLLVSLYGENRAALLFNSGYHANTGLIGALASATGGHGVILADKLVHASIIDGIKLSGAPFARFRHNDTAHLERIMAKYPADTRFIIVVESVYSMDGDRADLETLIDMKRRNPAIILCVDEAHAVGVEGPGGLGMCMATGHAGEVDIIVGTFGKALASSGAFAIMSPAMKRFMVNRARSLIFSTALPPLAARWSRHMLLAATGMDSAREHLRAIGARLHRGLLDAGVRTADAPSHILPYIVGDAAATVKLSQRLLECGFKVLPIRTPTVPPGTERLRLSLSAALDREVIDNLVDALTKTLSPCNAG